MFKLFSPTFFVVPVGWLTVLALLSINAATPFLQTVGIKPQLSWSVLIVQAVVTVVLATPLWRVVWKIVPQLNKWVYPDLNGEWDIQAHTNWPRIDATLSAAKGERSALDTRSAPEQDLPPLGKMELRARITQSWLKMQMVVWSDATPGPIKESKTLSVDPFRAADGRHGLNYVFQQENASPNVTDDRTFLGAARLELDRDRTDVLLGRMWTDRMWRRGMNTAADVRLSRRDPKPSRRRKGRS